MAAMTGFDGSDLVGNVGLDPLDPRDSSGAVAEIAGWSVQPDRALPGEVQITAVDGSIVWLSCSYSRVPAREGRRASLVVIARNVTQARELELLKDDFVAVVSHELRTPLVPIKGWAQTLLTRGDRLTGDQRRTAAQSILRESQRLESLVLNILESSRVEVREGEAPAVVDVFAIAGRVVDVVRSVQATQRVRLFPPPVCCDVQGSGVWIERVLSNLVANAVKYSPDSEPVDIGVDLDGDHVVVSVTDRGPGIPAEDQERIFARFERLAATQTQTGTGLGLYISRRLARGMGGDVTVTSTPGSGSTFALRLPSAAGMASPGRRAAATGRHRLAGPGSGGPGARAAGAYDGDVSAVPSERPGAAPGRGVDAVVAGHYGDPFGEQRAVLTTGAVVDRSHRGVLRVSGPDRLSWLHSLTTQHLESLAPGVPVEALVLSPHGHVEHHLVIVDDGESTLIDVEPGTEEALAAYLNSMRFMLHVDVSDVTPSVAVISVVTEDSVENLHVPRAELGDRVDAIELPLVGHDAFEAVRVAAHRPRLGFETDHRTIPHEIGWIGNAVHMSKGCYRGQETVARVHNLGRPPRRLILGHLDGTADELPPPQTPIELDGRQVGFLGTAVQHAELGPVALAVVKRQTADDALLTVSGYGVEGRTRRRRLTAGRAGPAQRPKRPIFLRCFLSVPPFWRGCTGRGAGGGTRRVVVRSPRSRGTTAPGAGPQCLPCSRRAASDTGRCRPDPRHRSSSVRVGLRCLRCRQVARQRLRGELDEQCGGLGRLQV